jgi:xanthine dehydrogenase iron-sulfur cluster and FAD-binding subunit A
MKPPPFRYVRPATLQEALGLLGDGSLVLAGGQSLIPLLNLRQLHPRRLVDIAAIPELHVLDQDPGGHLIVGAGIAMAVLEQEPALRTTAPLLAGALALVGNPQVRARGTIGGSVAYRDPVSEVITALVALQATATVRGRGGQRRAPVGTLALDDGELLVDLHIPPPPAGSGSACHEVALRHGSRALAVAAAVAGVDDAGCLTSVRIAVAGVAPVPTALAGTASMHGLRPEDARVGDAVAATVQDLPAIDDPRASERYRREAVTALAVRAVCEAARRAAPAPGPPGSPGAARVRVAAAAKEREGESEIGLTVNGQQVRAQAEPRLLLCDLLRDRLGLRATHVGCEHGVCGACNVLLDGVAVRSCLMLAVQADGRQVQTLEGLRDTADMEELAEAFVTRHALQCGFCTPGFLVTLAELRRRGAPAGAADLAGNLCRCTGYAPILRVAAGLA